MLGLCEVTRVCLGWHCVPMGQTQSAPPSLQVQILACEEQRVRLLSQALETTEEKVARMLLKDVRKLDMKLNELRLEEKDAEGLEWLTMRDQTAIQAAARRQNTLAQQEKALRRSGINPKEFVEKARKAAMEVDRAREHLRQGVEAQRGAIRGAVEKDRDRALDAEEESKDRDAEDEEATAQAIGDKVQMTDYMRMWELEQQRRQRLPIQSLVSSNPPGRPVGQGALRQSER